MARREREPVSSSPNASSLLAHSEGGSVGTFLFVSRAISDQLLAFSYQPSAFSFLLIADC